MSPNYLLCNIKSSDTKAYEELFNLLYPSMCVLARSYVKDDCIAEDIAQDAFIKLWNNRDKYENISSVKSYLYVMVKNSSINHLKRDKLGNKYTESIAESDYQDFNNRVVEEETYRILQQAIDDLPRQSSKVMGLILMGMQNQDIADRLDVSVNTVKTLKYNSMKTLKSKLKDYSFILVLLVGDI